MSGRKLNQLIQAVRRSGPPPLPATLADDVVRAIRREPLPSAAQRPSLFEELNAAFPRLVVVTVVVLALGVAANLALEPHETTDWGDGISQISTQWLLLPDGL